MKTIKTLAGEIGVTKQAIFQKMKKEPLASGLNNLTTRLEGTVYVYPEGEKLIKEQFDKTQKFSNDYGKLRADNSLIKAIWENFNFLQDQLVRKDRQLDILNLHISIKNRQIENLSIQIKELNMALISAQDQTKTAQALHAGEIHRGIVGALIHKEENNGKKSFWKKSSNNKHKNLQR